MRRALPTLLALSLYACAPHASWRDRGLQPARSTDALLDEGLDARRFAVLVGVDSYADPALGDLRHAVADATAVAEVLRSDPGGFDQVLVLTGAEHTTRTAIAEALKGLRVQVRARDSVVVYFSGHGTGLPDAGAWRRYLLASDSRVADLEGTALELSALQRWLGTLPATRRALVVDACFDGGGKSVLRPELGQAPTESTLTPPTSSLGIGESHLFATTAGRPAREDDRLGHGVYTHYLLQAMSWAFAEADLDGDRLLSTWEAHDFARRNTIAYTSGAQVPEAALRVVGEADLHLVGDRTHRKKSEQAMLYLYGHDVLRDARVFVDGRDRGPLNGVIPVAPGRHHVLLEGAAEEPLVDGFVEFEPGHTYRADNLARSLHGPSQVVGLRSATVASAPFRHVVGGVTHGAEVWWMRRMARGAGQGLFVQGTLGGALSLRRGWDELVAAKPRSLWWLGADLGYQRDWRRVQLRGSLSTSAMVIPPSYLRRALGDRPDTLDDTEAGWWFVASGPSLGLGYVVSPDWTVGLSARVQGTWLDVDTGGRRLVLWTTLGAGVELAR